VDSRKRIALFCCFKEDVGWLKNSKREIGMPVKWLEAEKLIKVSHQTFAWWNLIQHMMLSD
jgi:hypothetical protein